MRNKKQDAGLSWLLKRFLFLAVIAFLVVFTLIPVHGAIKVHTVRESIASWYGTEPIRPAMAYYFTRELSRNLLFYPLNLEMLCAVFGAMGFGGAMVLFGYRFSRKQSMMFAGLPVTRSRDFRLRTAAFLILVVCPAVLCCLGYPLIVILSGLKDYFDPGLYLRECLALIMILLYGYAAGALSAQLFGTLWAAALGGVLLIGALEMISFGWSLFTGCYLQTLNIHPIRSMIAWSPVYTLYKAVYRTEDFHWLPGTAAILAMGGLAWWTCGRNRPERAGLTLNIQRIEKPLLILAAVLGGTLGGVLFIVTFNRELSLYLGILLGAGLAWIVAKMLVEQNIRLHLQGWRLPAAALGAMLLCCLGLRADILGLCDRMPAPEDVRAMTVSSYSSWDDQMETIVRVTEKDNLDAVRAWTELMRDQAAEMRKKQPFSLGSYGELVNIRWEDENHQILERQYSQLEDQTPALEALQTLVNSREYRTQKADSVVAYQETGWNARMMEGLQLQDEDFQRIFGFGLWNGFERQKPESLREAIRADIMERTWEDMQGMAVASVYFYEIDEKTDAYTACPSQVIYASDERTIRALWGERADQVLSWVRGGWAESDEVLVFRCEYASGDGEDQHMIRYTRADSPAEAQAWLARTSQCGESLFKAPENPDVQIQIYTRPTVRRWADLEGRTELLEQEDFWNRLPEYCNEIYGWVGYAERSDLPRTEQETGR